MALSKAQVARYSRQLILPEVGVSGQNRLSEASVLVIGAGGLGSPVLFYLSAAGVGRIGVIDADAVAWSNLHRQTLYETPDVGRPKAVVAAERIRRLNPEISVEAIEGRFDAANAKDLVSRWHMVIDGSDNFATRYLENDACVLANRFLVHGGVVNFQGQVMSVRPRQSACYRCVFPEPPAVGSVPSCQEAGVLGAEAGLIGSLMAHEALKAILGVGEPLLNRLVVFDGRLSRFREVPVRRNPDCAVCGEHPTINAIQSIESAPTCAG